MLLYLNCDKVILVNGGYTGIFMAYEEKTLESNIVYKGKIFDIRRDKILAVNDKI